MARPIEATPDVTLEEWQPINEAIKHHTCSVAESKQRVEHAKREIKRMRAPKRT